MKGVEIETGICGNDQESSFMNSTLQQHGELEFSVGTTVVVPESVKTEEDLRLYLLDVLGDAVIHTRWVLHNRLRFEVQIGPAGDGETDNEEEDDDA